MTRARRPSRDEPVALRDAVASVGRELGIPEPGALQLLVSAWPEIVGANVATHASIRAIRDGVCTIEADAPAWATQLRYLETKLVERAAECCGPGVVTTVRIVVSGREEPAKFRRREGPNSSL